MWPAQRLKVHFITLLFRLRGLEVRFIALDVCYNKTIAKQKGRGSHDSTIPVCSRHIEVYSATGEFLFSADTMQEAWEDYQDEMSA